MEIFTWLDTKYSQIKQVVLGRPIVANIECKAKKDETAITINGISSKNVLLSNCTVEYCPNDFEIVEE